ncbi:PH domain-containing protein [Staphylococcus hyicus]|uniref:PH domain-containing protein n=1 Tax=Staphylococcus hyicus TaxID=1284 RepID=UPI00208E3F6A|nr:PH domain-containing protein [Staphylococcus hyicus]MCO4329405.1 PH domain-containing protein [Staphylococcus hyicus]MCO4336613.1 PH domain-containing protein [Staphylococcus hyicus]
MSNPQKLHPISYITGLIEAIKQNIFVFIIFIFFQLKSFNWYDIWSYVVPAIIFSFFLISFCINIVRVYKTRYWIEDGYFIVTTGVFNLERKELHIKRIQSIDANQSVVNRIIGGVNLQLKTPSDSIELDTITKQQSERIREELEKVKGQFSKIVQNQDDKGEPVYRERREEDVLYTLSNKNLLYMAMTSGAILVTLATVAPIIGTFQNVINWKWLFGSVNHVFSHQVYAVMIGASAIIVLSYIIGVIITMIKFYGFTLHRRDDYLHIKFGLLNIRRMTIPITRVQAVVEDRSFIRTFFGYTAYAFIITSDHTHKEDEHSNGKVMILPFIERRLAQQIISDITPHLQFNHVTTGLPWRGFHRRFWIVSVCLMFGATLGHVYYSPWVWLPTMIIVGYLILHSYIAIRASGVAIHDAQIAIKQVRLFGYRTSYFKREKVIGYRQNAHPLMQKANLSHFSFLLAKGDTNEAIGLHFQDIKAVTNYRRWYINGGEHDENNA